MPWVVDTCVAIDVAVGDKTFGNLSANFLESKLIDGLVLCPVSFVELAPQFDGNVSALEEFCNLSGIDIHENWCLQDTLVAAEAFSHYIQLRRINKTPKRPVADILIGAFSCRFQGLITRNPKDFSPFFKTLNIEVPK